MQQIRLLQKERCQQLWPHRIILANYLIESCEHRVHRMGANLKDLRADQRRVRRCRRRNKEPFREQVECHGHGAELWSLLPEDHRRMSIAQLSHQLHQLDKHLRVGQVWDGIVQVLHRGVELLLRQVMKGRIMQPLDFMRQ
jgi:hypothetical protein